jgi:hypothetical protein
MTAPRPVPVKLAVAYLAVYAAMDGLGLLLGFPALAAMASDGRWPLLAARIVPAITGAAAAFLILERRPLARPVGLAALLVTYGAQAYIGWRALAARLASGDGSEAALTGMGTGMILHLLVFVALWSSFAFSAASRAYFRGDGEAPRAEGDGPPR